MFALHIAELSLEGFQLKICRPGSVRAPTMIAYKQYIMSCLLSPIV